MTNCAEIKHVIDTLGRGQKDGDVKGTHFGQILTYLQSKKEPKNVALSALTRMQGLAFGRLYSFVKRWCPSISAYESERRVSNSRTIVLTADQALMTNFSGISFFDFGHCIPYRLVPEPFLKKVLGSPLETDGQGRAKTATYPLRKVEAALLNAGFEKQTSNCHDTKQNT